MKTFWIWSLHSVGTLRIMEIVSEPSNPSPLEKNTMYRKTTALCSDGKVRTVYYSPADSFFTNPAWTRVRGRYVPGYITSISEVDLPPTMIPKSKLEFVPCSQNSSYIPNLLRSTKAIWDRTFPMALSAKYRWIWRI